MDTPQRERERKRPKKRQYTHTHNHFFILTGAIVEVGNADKNDSNEYNHRYNIYRNS